MDQPLWWAFEWWCRIVIAWIYLRSVHCKLGTTQWQSCPSLNTLERQHKSVFGLALTTRFLFPFVTLGNYVTGQKFVSYRYPNFADHFANSCYFDLLSSNDCNGDRIMPSLHYIAFPDIMNEVVDHIRQNSTTRAGCRNTLRCHFQCTGVPRDNVILKHYSILLCWSWTHKVLIWYTIWIWWGWETLLLLIYPITFCNGYASENCVSYNIVCAFSISYMSVQT